MNSLLQTFSLLLLAAMLTNSATAGPGPKATATIQPRRIYDAEKEQYVANPDYREPAVVIRASLNTKPAAEPKRIFDAATGNFISNPAYREPRPVVATNERPVEPRRIYDPASGQYKINPAYRDSVVSGPMVNHPSVAPVRGKVQAEKRASSQHVVSSFAKTGRTLTKN